MQLRIFTEPQEGADYGTLLSVAQATEQLGFDAFFRSDHYLAMTGPGLPGPTDAWITTGSPPPGVAALAPARFGALTDDVLVSRGIWQYAHYYDPAGQPA